MKKATTARRDTTVESGNSIGNLPPHRRNAICGNLPTPMRRRRSTSMEILLRHEPPHGGSVTDASAMGVEQRSLPVNGEGRSRGHVGYWSSSPWRTKLRREAGRGWCAALASTSRGRPSIYIRYSCQLRPGPRLRKPCSEQKINEQVQWIVILVEYPCIVTVFLNIFDCLKFFLVITKLTEHIK
jgi:hypothetical protein